MRPPVLAALKSCTCQKGVSFEWGLMCVSLSVLDHGAIVLKVPNCSPVKSTAKSAGGTDEANAVYHVVCFLPGTTIPLVISGLPDFTVVHGDFVGVFGEMKSSWNRSQTSGSKVSSVLRSYEGADERNFRDVLNSRNLLITVM
jgi:hypothetical protein